MSGTLCNVVFSYSIMLYMKCDSFEQSHSLFVMINYGNGIAPTSLLPLPMPQLG